MKIECLKEKLTEALSKTEKVVGKNLTLPVLSCVLLEAKQKNLSIRATNLDLGIEITLPVRVVEEGVVAIPGGTLAAYVANMYADKNLKLETAGGNLHVSSDDASTTFKAQNHEDFPTIPYVESENPVKIKPQEFVRGLKAVWYSSAVSSMKPELSSVYVHPGDNEMVFVATDSFRLAEKKVRTGKGESELGSLLIPFKNVSEIVRVLEGIKDEVEVHLGNSQIAFKAPSLYLTSRVIEGSFPDYQQIIPKEAKTEAVVLKEDLIRALKISNIFSDTFNQVRVKVDPAGKKLELAAKNNEVGENVNRIQAAVTGDLVEINFNHRYIVDCLSSIESDSVTLSFNGLNKPMIMRGVGDRSFMYLVMPMNR